MSIDATGTVIGKKYCLQKELGRGGSGCVYLALDYALGKRWAVKVLTKETELAQQESAMLKKLEHPMLPRIVDRLEEGEQVYLVMDYLEGISLKELSRQHKKPSSRQLLSWSISLCEVLEYLHAQTPQIIYRDLKPENLILTKAGGLKLIDFGAACLYRKDRDNLQNFTGSHGYAAPEQYGGISTPLTDIYGLGKLMKELCSKKAYRKFKWIIKKCTRKNPRKRFKTMALLKKELVKLQQQNPRKTYLRRMTMLCLVVITLLGTAQSVLKQVQTRGYYTALAAAQYESAIEIFPAEELPYLKILAVAVQKGETKAGIEQVEKLRALYQWETQDHQKILGEIGKLYFTGNIVDEQFTVNYQKALLYFEQMQDDQGDYQWYQQMATNLNKFDAEIDWAQLQSDLVQREATAATETVVQEKIRQFETIATIYLSCRQGLYEQDPHAALAKGIELLEECLSLIQQKFPEGRDAGLRLEVQMNLAKAYYLRGMEADEQQEFFLKRSSELYESCVEVLPKGVLHQQCMLKLAYMKRIRQDYIRAESWYQNGIEEYPQEPEFYCAYGLMKLVDEGEVEQAAALYQKVKGIAHAEQTQNYQVLKRRLEAVG